MQVPQVTESLGTLIFLSIPSSLGLGSRSGRDYFVLFFYAMGTRSHEYPAIAAMKFPNAPGPFGDRGDTPRWGLMAGFAACCTQYIRCCPWFPVQAQSAELPATTVGESSRGGSLRRHKAGPLIVLYLPSTTYCCRVVLLMCRCETCNKTPVAWAATGPGGALSP